MLKNMNIIIALSVPYIKKTFVVFKALFTPKGLFLLPPVVIAIPILTTKQHIGLMLGVLVIFDFLTGLAVSNKEKKEAEKTNEALKKKFLFNSDTFKSKTGVKLLLYMTTIFVAYWAEFVLKINTFNFSFSRVDFNITLSIMIVWILVELYSIIFENIKDLGFDVLAVFKKIINAFKSVKKEYNKDE